MMNDDDLDDLDAHARVPSADSSSSLREASVKEERASEEAAVNGSEEEDRRKSLPSFEALSRKMEQEKEKTPLKKMKHVRNVANNAVELKEVLAEQKTQSDAISGLRESLEGLKEDQNEALRAISSELFRLATLVEEHMSPSSTS